MASGKGSGGCFGAAAGVGGKGAEGGGAGAGVDVLEAPDWGEASVSCRAGTACGSSMVEDAMSSSRAVAASSLFARTR